MIIPEQAFSTLVELAEDILARAGYAVVSLEIAALLEDVERRIGAGLPVRTAEFEAITYAIVSSSVSEYHQAPAYV